MRKGNPRVLKRNGIRRARSEEPTDSSEDEQERPASPERAINEVRPMKKRRVPVSKRRSSVRQSKKNP